MNVYLNQNFKGYGLEKAAAIVVAESQEQAADFLQTILAQIGIDEKIQPKYMIPLYTAGLTVTLIHDGDFRG